MGKAISNKQKRAVEKVTGKPWNGFHPEALRAYFDFTDRGDKELIQEILGRNFHSWVDFTNTNKVKEDLYELYCQHIHHPHTVELWKQDFREGLLFLWDFLEEGMPTPYIEHAFEIYEETTGSIPTCYREHLKAPTKYRE